MLRSMALGRCPYDDGAHEFVRGVCRLCLEEREALAKRAERGRLFELQHQSFMPVATTPTRIQRKRTKGWRMPEGTVYVGRPTQYGNPYVIGETYYVNEPFEFPLPTPREPGRYDHGLIVNRVDGPAQAVAYFDAWARTMIRRDKTWLRLLRGHDLACWCPLDQPCHADVLLELANA